MIEDARQIAAGSTLKGDLCIVGGGAAGICLALEYTRLGGSAILIPGGGPNQTSECIDLYRGSVSPAGTHEPLEENRLRMWGGTTTVWGGRCIPFDEIDFISRAWIPHSGWPISQSDISPYLPRASILCESGIADFDARTVFPEKQGEILRGFDNESFASWPLEKWSIPTDFSKRYDSEIKASPRLRVLMHSHAIHLGMDVEGKSLDHVVASCVPGRTFRIKACRTVLACGALENARLMLASRNVCKGGIGNDRDLVGRYYQSHRFGVCGHVVLKDPRRNFIYEFEKDREGVYCRRRFWLTPEAQQRHGTANAIGFFFRPVGGSAEHRNAMVSSILLAKTFLGGARKGPKRLASIIRDQKDEILTHLGIIMRDGHRVAGQLAAVAYTRYFQKRRLPTVLAPRSGNRFDLFFQTEHVPNPESRIMLDESHRDDFGLPRLDVKIRFGDTDFRTVRTFIDLFSQRIQHSGLGDFHLSDSERESLSGNNSARFNSNSHNIGTTRMSGDRSHGVVDRDCKVHDIENLYVAGSSVFPTSSHANPTLMIVTLAVRLAEHLAGLKRSSD